MNDESKHMLQIDILKVSVVFEGSNAIHAVFSLAEAITLPSVSSKRSQETKSTHLILEPFDTTSRLEITRYSR